MCFVPMCKKLIKAEMLDSSQKKWLNDYHKKTAELLIPECKAQGWDDLIPWIEDNCAALYFFFYLIFILILFHTFRS